MHGAQQPHLQQIFPAFLKQDAFAAAQYISQIIDSQICSSHDVNKSQLNQHIRMQQLSFIGNNQLQLNTKPNFKRQKFIQFHQFKSCNVSVNFLFSNPLSLYLCIQIKTLNKTNPNFFLLEIIFLKIMLKLKCNFSLL